MREYRVGHGYDVHKFAPDRRLILGGIDIPNDVGLLGHSDADVLVHAVMDALLGAAGMRDIGYHFPDSREEFRGVSSLVLLSEVKELLANAGYSVVNIDSTLVLQRPKVAAYIGKMAENIATVLGIGIDRVNVKATTEEKLGFTGEKLGIAAHAVCLLFRAEH